ncbi:hypothetical protein U1Q18_050929 [Sarracenia purpurea var. burkii]
MVQTSRRRSFMDVIKSFIYSDSESKVTSVNKARVAPKAAKAKGRMGARRMTEIYQPYEKQNAADFQQGEMPRYHQRNAADFHERGVQRNYQRNADIFPKKDMQTYYEQKARELYGGEMPAYDVGDGPDFSAKDLGSAPSSYSEYDPQLTPEEKRFMKNNEKVIRPMNVDRNLHNAINHYIYVHHVGHPNVDNAQKFKNERNPARARRSRANKNGRQAPKARQNFRAKAAKVNGMGTGYMQRGMNNARKKYKSMKAQKDNIAQNNPAGVHRFDQDINNHHAPGALHPRAENNFAHFHEVNHQANHFNPQSHLHEISKGQNLPPHQSIHQDHQFDKVIHGNHMHENMHSPRIHPQQFAEHGHMRENAAFHYNQQHPLHEVQHIKPQNEQKDILHFHSHNEAIQHINRLSAGHIDHQNLHGYQYQPYRAGSVNNPNNLPVLHQVAIRQPYQGIPNVGAAMRNFRKQNAAKIGQSRKVNAPRARKSRGGKPKAARARQSKMVNSFHQYNVDTEGHTPVHFIDVVQYHYEPRENMRMLQ